MRLAAVLLALGLAAGLTVAFTNLPLPAVGDLVRVSAVASPPARVDSTRARGRSASAGADDARQEMRQDVRQSERACTSASLPVRAAQVLVVGLPGVTEAGDPLVRELDDVGVGGILITKTNVEDATQVRTLIRALRRDAEHGLLVTTDEEPGRVSSFGALIGRTSSARTLARRGTVEEVEAFAAQMGEQLASFGVDADLAPVADLDGGPARGVIGDRSFSADPQVAADYSLAFADGLRSAGVLPAVKHFPGHGRSAADSHEQLAVVDVALDELMATDVRPFAAHVDAGTPVVMLNHVAYAALDPDLPASLSPRAYALLRSLGFQGVAMTDSLGMGAVNLRWPFPEAAVMAVRAGADAVLATDGNHARAMRDAIVAAVDAGTLEPARLDEAVARMVALKGEDPDELVCTTPAPPAKRSPGGDTDASRRP